MILRKFNRIKLVLDGRYLENTYGGIANYLHAIINYLDKDKYSIFVISVLPLYLKNVENITIPLKIHRLYWEQIQLEELLKKIKPDLYHATANYGIPFITPFKTILTVHDLIPLSVHNYFQNSKFPFISKMLYRWEINSSINKAKVIICNSKYTSKEVISKFHQIKNKIVVIPMGIDNLYLRTPKPNVFSNYLLCHGGLGDRKNNSMLIRCFAEASLKYPIIFKNLKIIFTGDNRHQIDELTYLSRSLGIDNRINFAGCLTKSQLFNLLCGAKAVIYPSSAEGFGIPVLEAMSQKIPIVASNLPVFHEVADDVPLYFNIKQPESLIQSIITAVSESHASRVGKGRVLAEKYTWNHTIELTDHIYEKTMNDDTVN